MADIIIFISLLALGYGFGRRSEAKHYQSIIEREEQLQIIPAITSKHLPQDKNIIHSQLVTGSVVVSVDYFKRFIAAMRSLAGGRITSYETLLDRARREAILRMKQQTKDEGSDIILNVKLETASIYKGRGSNIGAVEVLAYGTSLKRTSI